MLIDNKLDIPERLRTAQTWKRENERKKQQATSKEIMTQIKRKDDKS